MKFVNPFRPLPAPPAFGAGNIVPEGSARLLSKLIFQWVVPLLDVGFSRPLEKDDLWELPDHMLTASVSCQVENSFYSRCEPEKRPQSLREGLDSVSQASSLTEGEEHNVKKTKDLATTQKQEPNHGSFLFFALHRTFLVRIWLGGFIKLFYETLKITRPLITKVFLTWLSKSYLYHRLSDEKKATGTVPEPPGISYGIGVAIGLFAIQEAIGLMTNHYFQNAKTTGLLVRTGLTGTIFRKSLRISGRAKLEHNVGQITTMISTDVTRLDSFSVSGHNLWVSPIQIAIGIGLLVGNLGYSALVGLAVLIIGLPVQIALVRISFKERKKCVKITDARVRLTTEILQGIRLIKSYAWEAFYIHQIGKLREREIATIRTTALARSALVATVGFIPVLASIVSFITYALSGHDLNVAVVFSSLQLFNAIRNPLTYFPTVLSSFSDALVALDRISRFLVSEELPEPYLVDYELKHAVQIEGDFTWEVAGRLEDNKFAPEGGEKKAGQQNPKVGSKNIKGKNASLLPIVSVCEEGGVKEKEIEDKDKPFELRDLKFSVSKGSFVAVVGRVGSGKSSLFEAIIGEMRKTRGEVAVSGSVAYASQTPWIQNATLRENVLFGQPDDEKRFRSVIRACSLDRDLEVLPQGEFTGIGEKGINLSGGQKARISLARAAYSNPEIVLLDDPLSAVDAYVGKAILDECLLAGPLANRTRILITHALHVLDKTDYIYIIANGVISEQGTFDTLMKDSVSFSRLMEEYRSTEQKERKNKEGRKAAGMGKSRRGRANSKERGALMQGEERKTGAVTWDVYTRYLRFAGGIFWGPCILFLLTLARGAQVANNLFLGFWTARSIHGFGQGEYMAVYATLGVAQAIISFLLSFIFAWTGLLASLELFKASLNAVLRSPTPFFDTTPIGMTCSLFTHHASGLTLSSIGCILSRLSKDQDTLDHLLAQTSRQFLSSFTFVFGAVALVSYTFPPLAVIFVPMTVIYYLISMYYRRTSVEIKRLDSLMRSTLYGLYSETLTGLSTIRAYGVQANSLKEIEQGLDMQNRAYYMSVSSQRWLGIRLDLLGNTLVLAIVLFAARFRHTVNPAKVGVVLSYTLGITQVFSDMVTQFVLNEQNMNAVERVLHYTELPLEGKATTPDDPPPTWPCKGHISFTDVKLAYRPGLPLVLKGVTFDVKPGEKVGIVGRTGAGKSSLLQALLRTVELREGRIEIDGYNIRDIGLDALRGRLALVPQDSTLFLGTLRENLDPQGLRTDAELVSALQRAWLLPRDEKPDPVADVKFNLDAPVGDAGSNFSAGEKQLLALCRALVKNSRMILLDEATSSVDAETDAKIQKTIQIEFADATLVCIAHRLNTIAYYDRIMVMDAGRIAEFDAVMNLFDNEQSIFRSLCNEANLQRVDILRIRKEHESLADSHIQ